MILDGVGMVITSLKFKNPRDGTLTSTCRLIGSATIEPSDLVYGP
jgi:hypothetical protein